MRTKEGLKNKRICLVLPSIHSGGLERVITELASYFSNQNLINVHVICLFKGDLFFPLPENVLISAPSFKINKSLRLLYVFRLFFWLRNIFLKFKPDIVLSFGGKFNSFVLLADLGISNKTFISDRSKPGISYGFFLDLLNPVMYRRATGIIAQTNLAKSIMQKSTRHKNIIVIGNPLKIKNEAFNEVRENIILNVGRFITSKNQELLVQLFSKLEPHGWRLVFLGEGRTLESVKKSAKESGIEESIEFLGSVQDISTFYNKSKIFAFTSDSEGFPNALGEAMAHGLACISFDCKAGPSDLIDDGINGFLIPETQNEMYIQKLQKLMNDENLRQEFGIKAMNKVQKFNKECICSQYLQFISKNSDENNN